jgi:two-component system, OmpR family, response regulator
MEQRFEYRGTFADTPLPEVLAKVYRYPIPGEILAQREDRQCRIRVEGGAVTFAWSNHIEDSLGHFLLRRGVLTGDLYDRSIETMLRQGRRHGSVLVDLGVLSQEQLREVIGEQVRAILWSVFEWEVGEFVFLVPPPPFTETVRIEMPIPAAIVDGVRATASAQHWVHRLGPSWTVFERDPEGVIPDALGPAERAFLERVDGKMPLIDLCKVGPGTPHDNARWLYVFSCLGLLRKKPEPGARKFHWRTAGGALDT